MQQRFVGTALALAVLATAPQLQAQASAANKPEFGGFVGVGLPMGDFGEGVNTGWRIGGLAQFRPAALPVALRAEAGYQGFGGQNNGLSFNVLDVTGNAIYDFGATRNATTSFYVIGGAGVYNVNRGVGTNFGLNGGAGVNFNLSGFKAFAEARYHTVFADGGNLDNINIIPLTFGIRF